jgi:hypothetical protein
VVSNCKIRIDVCMNYRARTGWDLAKRTVAAWVLICVAETIHGTARILFLQPVVGDFRARQVSVFTGSILVLTIAAFLRRWIGAARTKECFAVGAAWVFLTLGFEVLLGRLMGLSWERILSDYDILHGGLLPLGVAVMFFAPLIASLFNATRRKPSSADIRGHVN